MWNEIEVLKNSLYGQQQYSRRNCILIPGISEQKGKYMDEQALKIIREKLGGTDGKLDLDETHRIRTFKEDKKKCRPIIVKFSRYNVHGKVFKNKKNIKGKDYSISETLTALKIKNLTEAQMVLDSQTCGLKTGKFYVRKTTKSRLLWLIVCRSSHYEVFLKNSCS